MISIGQDIIKKNHFPDGTQMLLNIPIIHEHKHLEIYWRYESDEEMVTLLYLKHHIDEHYNIETVDLIMPYLPNARMDRVKSVCEVFTLKYFCQEINNLKFSNVYVADPHSEVSLALLDHIKVYDYNHIISFLIGSVYLHDDDLYLFFPDNGALKRYSEACAAFEDIKKIYGTKKRDWNTGKILGLTIHDADGNELHADALNNKTVLMIDDIISYGGTLAYSADKLKELGADKIYAFATHVENSFLDEEKGTLIKRCESGVVQKIYTTDSIYSGPQGKDSFVEVVGSFFPQI